MSVDTDMRRYHAQLALSWYAGEAELERIEQEHGRGYADEVQRAWRAEYGWRPARCVRCDCGRGK